MKNGKAILLLVSALSLALVVGIFVGRNLRDDYANLSEGSASVAVSTTEAPKDYRLDINSATKVQLMELPGIGEKIAERIIDYRTQTGPFTALEDLLNIEGIGEKKLQEIEALVKVGG